MKLKIDFKIKQRLQRFWGFLKDIAAEMKKVHWLTLKETIKYTFMVILVSAIVSIFLGGVDFLLTTLLNKFVLK
jgi:preprotein translocase subunit SecE